MSFPVLGLHHVTATVDDAQADLNFARSALGLRLVKKTVNFDNHGVYHFYYGDERGTPGTIWTTFPYGGQGVPVGVHGAGQITTTSFSVPSASLDFWRKRLDGRGYAVGSTPPRFAENAVSAIDPSGLVIELVGADDDSRSPWIGSDEEIDLSNAIRGLHSVTMTVRQASSSIAFMQELLGYEVVARSGPRTRVAINGGGAGRFIDLLESSDAPAARNGLGTVHHVAMAIEASEQQVLLRNELKNRGIHVSPVMDRHYFQSIYFREPGGILFEVATMKPGFTVDEPIGELGRALKLPAAAEPRRKEIEVQLPEIQY